jgi:NAD(P)-dependent dehydrogenase (short-subunit alcohol dehydrogenase family)
MDLGLKDKLAFVSGSTAGIGFAIATALAGEGARVVVNGRMQPAVDVAIAEIRSRTGADAHGFAGDLSVASTSAALFRANPEVEILVNNFGIFEPKSFEDIADAEWVRFFEANVLSGVRLARLYLPAMRRANWGRIIFISSESAVQIPAEMIHYGMTKTAQLAVSPSAGTCRSGRGDGDHRQQRAPRPDKIARRRRIRRGARQNRKQVVRGVREGVLRKGAPDLAHQAIRLASRGREHGGLSREPVGFRDHRRRRARRWRGDQERILIGAACGLRAGGSGCRAAAPIG